MAVLKGCVAVALAAACCTCTQTPPSDQNAPATREPSATAPAADDDAAADDAVPLPAVRSAAALAALLPSDGTGCAPGARCLKVSQASGRPSSSGDSIAQCRGEFADFIVPRGTIPANYAGPLFQPNLIEEAHIGAPAGTRPWRSVDPRQATQRMPYLLALRNYAFASAEVRSLTPQLTTDTAYIDPAGGTVPAAQRNQKWYPAPRMIYGPPNQPGAREAAHGMTLERTINANELGENTAPFRNYAVAYYDARGARTYARTWSTATAGVDTPNLGQMKIAANSLVFKLLFSAAKATDFPSDLLAGSVEAAILPNSDGVPVAVRLLQIDIAVKDNRAGTTGWYFATYAFDKNAAGASPWLKMVPVGLMWGNDPNGAPLQESWINPAAPAYATAHLGVDGRLNGPVDNPKSACMSCHATAQAPALANMVPPASGPCLPQRANWFRDSAGTQAFGRFQPTSSTCETSLQGITLTAADESLQLASTVSRAITAQTFNPCTWDNTHPPSVAPPAVGRATPAGTPVQVFPVTRDPK